MEKLQASKILIKGAKLRAQKLEVNARITKLIEETNKKQTAVLKLKDVDQDLLKVVVQL